jgi:hypothetical protein
MTECDAKQLIDLVSPFVFLISTYVFFWSIMRLFR